MLILKLRQLFLPLLSCHQYCFIGDHWVNTDHLRPCAVPGKISTPHTNHTATTATSSATSEADLPLPLPTSLLCLSLTIPPNPSYFSTSYFMKFRLHSSPRGVKRSQWGKWNQGRRRTRPPTLTSMTSNPTYLRVARHQKWHLRLHCHHGFRGGGGDCGDRGREDGRRYIVYHSQILITLRLVEEKYQQERWRAISLMFTVIVVFIAVISVFKFIFKVIVFIDLYLNTDAATILLNHTKNFCDPEEPFLLPITSTALLMIMFSFK